MFDIAAAIKNPADFGFKFSMEPVSRKDGNSTIEVGIGPIVVVTELDKFRTAFPGVIESRLDGSSIRVASQGPVRRLLTKDKKTSLETLKHASLSAAVGVTARRGDETFTFPRDIWDMLDDKQHDQILARNPGKKLILVDADGEAETE